MNTLAMKPDEYIKELIDENLATKHDVESVKHEIELVKYAIELARKELPLKLGAIFTAGWVATIGIILGFLPLILK